MAIVVRGAITLLQVFDMPRSLRFYRDLLGFDVLETSGQGDRSGWVMLGLGGVKLMLNTAYDDDERPDASEAAGADVAAPQVGGYGFKGISVTDPDGFELTFHWPVTEPSE
jgi:glyoxylase I family protein